MSHRTALAALAAAALLLPACSSGPVTQSELCDGFDTLDTELLRGNAGIGNPLFDAAEDLGGLADRYDGPENVSADAAALHAVDDDESTDSNELRNATTQISALCGRPPVGLGGLLGGS
jgi:hypothetical protein